MNVGLILAGGSGLRMGGDRPKQYLETAGTPIIIRTVRNFTGCSLIDKLLIVCPAQFVSYTEELLASEDRSKIIGVIAGGASRRESSENGINALKSVCNPDDIVLIHDGARPNINGKIIAENVRLASLYGACETAFPSTDTIAVSTDGSFVSYVPPRSELWNVQTPQSFRYSVIEKAHSYCSALLRESPDAFPVTDDAGLILKCIADGVFDGAFSGTSDSTFSGASDGAFSGTSDSTFSGASDGASGVTSFGPVKVAIAMGSETNIKVTRPSDMVILEKLMEKEQQ